ncbi:cupin-like domain-containing protein [Ulvibacterium sp.]|uniref:cupin-like domain-containing protein n=1 Tax=Ulvibacterium sp. TaxID=2665914 RepID=UPI002618381E|nr:cupin-like domain-containing protein [Ulvibacterium sp.]
MGKFRTIPVSRVKNISKKDFLENYYNPQKPVLIEGLTKDWPAYGKWNLDYIQQRAGNQIVPLYDSKPTKGKQNSAAPATEMKLYDYLELLKNEPTDLRIFFYNILDSMPQLAEDFEYPDLGLKFFKRLPVMFFGGEGSKVLAHYDMDLADLVHVHFHGTKSVTLFKPEQTKYLYRVPFSVHNLETIDMDNPDFEKYPALQNVQGIQAEMKHGDALYMPSGYWHYIKYTTGGFSITLRALPTKPQRLLKTASNVLFMRNFENIMRRTMGQKWVNYKENKMVRRINKKYGKSAF